MDKNSVLLISNHHRPIPLFTHSMERLWDGGYQNFIVQDTCVEPWARYPGRASQRLGGNAHLNYFQGMQSYKKYLSDLPKEIKYIVLLDNDLFLKGEEVLDRYLSLFEQGEYDFASYYTHPAFYEMNPHSFADDFLAPVPMQEIYKESPNLSLCTRSSLCPEIYPWPYWENAFQITRRSMWDKLTEDDVSHGRKYLKALVREKARLATLKAFYKLDTGETQGIGGGRTVTQYGDGWFHFGDLMYFYYAAEDPSRFSEYVRVSPDSYTQSRFGCLLACRNELPKLVAQNISHMVERAGGEEACLRSWNNLIKGTFLEE